MDIVRIAGVDEELKAVAGVRCFFVAPDRFFFARDPKRKGKPGLVPAAAKLGERPLFIELAEIGDDAFFRQIGALRAPEC